MQPNVNNMGRWLRPATDKEIKRALKDKSAEVIEIPIIQMTYVVSHRYGISVRCAMMGGDTFDVECGWKYISDIALRRDKEELRHLALISP